MPLKRTSRAFGAFVASFEGLSRGDEMHWLAATEPPCSPFAFDQHLQTGQVFGIALAEVQFQDIA